MTRNLPACWSVSKKNKTTILNGRLPLLVDGYCNSLGSEAENLATAKIRANRVKSELKLYHPQPCDRGRLCHCAPDGTGKGNSRDGC